MVHTPGSHLLTTNQTQIISKTRTHRSQQSILLQLFFATQCYTSGSEIWDLHAKLVLFGTKFGLWAHLGPSPKFGTSLERLINSYTKLHSPGNQTRDLLLYCCFFSYSTATSSTGFSSPMFVYTLHSYLKSCFGGLIEQSRLHVWFISTTLLATNASTV